MNLNFVPATGNPFTMEVSYLDTIQEIKQQIQQRHQIPAEKQILIFNNQILKDDNIMYIDYPQIIDNSFMQLIISENQDSTPPPVNQEQPPPPSTTTATPPSTMFWEFGSPTGFLDPYDLWLLERPPDNSEPPPPPLEIPTTANTKFNQETANPDTTFSDLGILLEENTDSFPSWLLDMDLPDNTLNINLATSPVTTMSTVMSTARATPFKKITLTLNMPAIGFRMAMELEVSDYIWMLKEKIVHEVYKGIPEEKLVLRTYGVELHDHKTLHECGLLDHSEIDVSIKRFTPPSTFFNATTNINRKIPKVPKFPSSSSNATATNPSIMEITKSKGKNPMKPNIPKGPKKMKIMVLPFHGTKKVLVEVNANDNVENLRRELEKVNEREPLNLSEDGFFFIHKQSVMDEDVSFQMQNVREGDTIEIFNGRVTKAPPYLA